MTFNVASALDAIGRLLGEAEGPIVYRASGYQAGEVGVYFKRPPATPDRVVTLTLYPVSGPNTVGLQVRCRGAAGDYLDADTLAEHAYQALHGAQGVDLGGDTAVVVLWRSGSPMGIDDEGRDEHSDNYFLIVDRPGTSVVDVTT